MIKSKRKSKYMRPSRSKAAIAARAAPKEATLAEIADAVAVLDDVEEIVLAKLSPLPADGTSEQIALELQAAGEALLDFEASDAAQKRWIGELEAKLMSGYVVSDEDHKTMLSLHDEVLNLQGQLKDATAAQTKIGKTVAAAETEGEAVTQPFSPEKAAEIVETAVQAIMVGPSQPDINEEIQKAVAALDDDNIEIVRALADIDDVDIHIRPFAEEIAVARLDARKPLPSGKTKSSLHASQIRKLKSNLASLSDDRDYYEGLVMGLEAKVAEKSETALKHSARIAELGDRRDVLQSALDVAENAQAVAEAVTKQALEDLSTSRKLLLELGNDNGKLHADLTKSNERLDALQDELTHAQTRGLIARILNRAA